MMKNAASLYLVLTVFLLNLCEGMTFFITPHQAPLRSESKSIKMSSSQIFSTPEIFDEDISLRFSGVGRLYHDENSCSISKEENAESPHMAVVDRLSESTVAIVGIGGVGSWAAEAICRSGVGNIILLDLDDICTSNINRQVSIKLLHIAKESIKFQ